MDLQEIDLSKLKAIGHDGQELGLLFERGNGILEFATTPAPRQALDGIRQLAAMAEDRMENAPSNSDGEIAMLPVDSSNIKAIGYAPDARVLQVDFLTGSRYRYFAVDQQVFDRFITATSKGQFLNREIKTAYEYCRID